MIISKVAIKSGMNYHQTKPFLTKLKNLGYIRTIDTGNTVNNHEIILYCTTKKGFEFMEHIREWVKLND